MTMRLDEEQCRSRLGTAGHGVFGTVHAARGVDVVPVVWVFAGDRITIPVDAIKAKSGARLQRLANLDADDRGVLLVDHYDDDWSRLWWVRVHGRAVEAVPSGEELDALAAAFPAYRSRGAVTKTIVMAVDTITGWAAGG